MTNPTAFEPASPPSPATDIIHELLDREFRFQGLVQSFCDSHPGRRLDDGHLRALAALASEVEQLRRHRSEVQARLADSDDGVMNRHRGDGRESEGAADERWTELRRRWERTAGALHGVFRQLRLRRRLISSLLETAGIQSPTDRYARDGERIAPPLEYPLEVRS